MSRLLPSLLLAAGLLGSSYHAKAQAPAKLWDRTLGGASTDRSQSIQQTSDGGYIVGGYSNSPLSGDKSQGGRGDFDYWVLKLDASGTKVWDQTLGGSNADILSTVQQTADGGYILGGTSDSPISGDKTQPRQLSDYWIIKLDASGTKQWDRTFGGSLSDFLTSVQQTSDGGYIVGGYSISPLSGDKTQASQGSNDYWVLKLDANGTKLWDRTIGGSSIDNLTSMQQTADGGYILGGESLSPLSGDKTQTSRGNFDYWIVKLAANGTTEWDRTFGSTDHDRLEQVRQTRDGGYILGGYSYSPLGGEKSQPSQGGLDYWVVKINANGSILWDKTLGGWGTEFFADVQQTSDGGYLIGGSSDSDATGDKTRVSQGDGDCWLIKLSASGVTQWDKSLGGNRVDDVAMLRQTSDGGYILAGGTASDVSSDKTQPSQGGQDFWIIKLAADPLGTESAASRPTLSAYPNPASTQFTLRGPLGTPYQLLNQLGQVVRAGQLSAQPLDVQALPAGLYLLRDQTTGRTTQLVKE